METLSRSARNLAGFLCGWLFILAIALGMEAAHAIEFKSVGNGNPWSFEYVGPSGSDLCEQLRTSQQQTANSNQTVTVKPPPITLTRTEVSGACVISVAEPCYTDYQGIQHCPTQTTTPATTYYSRCTATDPWVLINASAPACATPIEPPKCTTHPSGTQKRVTGPMSGSSLPEQMCIDNCTFTGQGAEFPTFWFFDAVSTGDYCDAEAEGQLDPTFSQTITTDAGPFLPAPPSQPTDGKKGCGTLDGEYVCLGEPTGTEKCTRLANGGGFCVTVTNTGKTPDKKPDNGTPGTEAQGGTQVTIKEPDANGQQQVVAQTTIYNSTTINQSTNQGDGGSSSSGGSSGSSGSSSSGSSSSGGSSGSSGGDGECTGDDCGGGGGDGSVKGPGGTARGFGESVGAVSTAWNNSPAVTKIKALQIPSGGTCPAPVIEVFNTSITMNAHCTIAETIRSPLRAVMLALWVIVAVGVFLRP